MRILLVSDLHYRLRQYDWVYDHAPDFDVVVTVCDTACPIPPRHRILLRWKFPDPSAAGGSEEEQLETYRARNLMGVGLIPPDAVGDLAVLLASDKLRYTTGAMFPVDGGLPEAFPR